MIIVTGNVLVQNGLNELALELSQEHVERSRGEAGCLQHGVYVDAENPQRLMFFERWQDHAALSEHFKKPDSIAFVKKLKALLVKEPEMSIFDASLLN